MREIKFYAWLKTNGKWKYYRGLGGPVWSSKGSYFYLPAVRDDLDGVYLKIPDEAIPLQYTGLKDKNGEEIFDGDIARVHLYENMPNHDTWTGRVYSDVYSGWMMIDKPIARYLRDDDDSLSIEIIGNIYENPELLEQK